MDYVKRNYPAEFRAESDSGLIVGVPIVYDTPTDIGGWFQETICRGAISKDIIKDVRFFWNHNIEEKAVARTIIPIDKLGGMELEPTDSGVNMRMNPNRKRSDVNDLCIAIEDGVISGMSFMFGVKEERWEDEDTDYPKRFITKIDPLIEVSAVNFPAYSSTSIKVSRGDLPTEIDKAALDKMRERRRAAQESGAKSILTQRERILIYQYGGKL